MKVQIALKELKDIEDFVTLAQRSNEDILVSRGKYMVDGRSLLGLLSLNCYLGVTVEFSENNDYFKENIKKWEI